MRLLTTPAWALLVALPLLADDPEPPDPKKGKQNGPLLVRLVAKKAAYVLDRQGMTAEKFREAAKAGRVAAPAVDLVLELKNTSKENVTVRVSGTTATLAYSLKGAQGVVTASGRPKAGKGVPVPVAPPLRNVVLKPGEKHEIAITALDNTAVGRPQTSTFWTEPGTYTLTVQFRTTASGFAAAGKAKKAVANPTLMRTTTLESQPVKLTVKLK